MSRRPSPSICADCLRQHIRLSSDARSARRRDLVTKHAYDDPVVRLYVEQLFDHLTLGVKVSSRAQEQRHPAPPIPHVWTATELSVYDRSVVSHAFRP